MRVATLLAILALAPTARAQSLPELIAAARAHAPSLRAWSATARQRGAELDAARWSLLPSLEARAGYTRNAYEVTVEVPAAGGGTQAAPIQRLDQLDASVTLRVPLVDVEAWEVIRAAEETAGGTALDVAARAIELDREVVHAYFALVAARALEHAATRAEEVAAEALEVARARARAGIDGELDVDRAAGDRAAAQQALAEARARRALAVVRLRALTGRTVHRVPPLPVDHDEEPPLSQWLAHASALPSVRAAEARARAESARTDAAWAALAPTLHALASAGLTNASGFGPADRWALGVEARLAIDAASIARAEARREASNTAAALADAALEDARVAIETAWHGVRTALARSRATAERERAAVRAERITRDRHAAGAATALEVSVAGRELLASRSARIEADADLAYARALLCLAAGIDVGGSP